MRFPRSSGILLHPTSLPSSYGIGDLGQPAYAFVDALAKGGQSLWQVLPLGPTGYGDSPYQAFSAFAGNPLLVSLEKLVEENLLKHEDLADAPSFSAERVEYGRVIDFKLEKLGRAFENFKQTNDAGLKEDFGHFHEYAALWLEDYALFRAIKNSQAGKVWSEWDEPLRKREPTALDKAREDLRDQIEAQKFFQYLFFKQWIKLKAYCAEKKIKIIGDLPIFVAYDSSDVWTHPDLFKLDEEGHPRVVAGVPPDYFSKTGQLWGNPIYDWEKMQSDGFKWWMERIEFCLRTVDIMRVDHFRGFAAAWEVPGSDKTAERGQWVKVPGRELFRTLRERLGELPIIAENLGHITPDVENLRREFDFPGMRILQFAFGGDSKNLDLPHNYHHQEVVYTGTHDNDTTMGWFNAKAGEGSTRSAEQIERERAYCMKYLNTDGKEIHWDFIRAALASVPDIAIIPMQDVLGLGTEARMNLPASTEGNWDWRYRAGVLTDEMLARLKDLTELYGRQIESEKEEVPETESLKES